MIYTLISHYLSFLQPESEYHGYSIREDTSNNEQKHTHKLVKHAFSKYQTDPTVLKSTVDKDKN